MKSFTRKAAAVIMALGMGMAVMGCEIDTDDDDIFKASKAQQQVQPQATQEEA